MRYVWKLAGCFLNVLKLFIIQVEGCFMSLVVYLRTFHKYESYFSFSRRKLFSLECIKLFSLSCVWLLTLYYFNQISSTMKINVIGFAIIRVKYTVICYEKNTKNVSGAHYRDIFYGNYSNFFKTMQSLILIRFSFLYNFNKTIQPRNVITIQILLFSGLERSGTNYKQFLKNMYYKLLF